MIKLGRLIQIFEYMKEENKDQKDLLEADVCGPDLNSELPEPVLQEDYDIGGH